jgi:riboflavin biosynthesis pyrimidine reductase
MVTVDNRGSLRWSKNFINLSGQIGNFHLVTIVTKSTPKDYLAYLKTKNISYIFAGEADVDFKQAMKTLTDKFGIKELLLEGGGLLNGSMMAADLVDEISLLTLPLVLNKSSAPSLFDHQDTPELDLKMYKLMETKQPTNDTIWLHYQKERDVK